MNNLDKQMEMNVVFLVDCSRSNGIFFKAILDRYIVQIIKLLRSQAFKTPSGMVVKVSLRMLHR
jgi:hypothetical protein